MNKFFATVNGRYIATLVAITVIFALAAWLILAFGVTVEVAILIFILPLSAVVWGGSYWIARIDGSKGRW